MITGQQLAQLLVRHGIVQTAAIEDAEGYDNHQTLNAIKAAARELGEEAESDAAAIRRALEKAAKDYMEEKP